MRALIADDEPLLRAELRDALERLWPALDVIAEVPDGRRAVSVALELRPEVVFLDISMPHLDGMSAAQQLRERGYAGEIVFVTAYDEHALRAFDARAIDYLVKPLELERLGETVTRLQARLAAVAPVGQDATAATTAAIAALEQNLVEAIHRSLGQTHTLGQAIASLPAPPDEAPRSTSSPWLRATRGAQTKLVAIADIACLRAVPGYTQIVTRDGEHLIEQPLKSLQARLDPAAFVQIHRAAIINLHFVERIVRDRPGHCVVELKHGLGKVEASRTGAELLRSL